jgi:hypothetical protein
VKTLLKGVVVLFLFTGPWQAGIASALSNPDTGPGCGLGKKLWEGWKGQKQLAPQLFMASTNVSGSYTFAITSGTSGCSNDGTVWDSQKASLFIEINYASLEADMATGGGEHLASLAALMGIEPDHQAEFFSRVQREFRSFGPAGSEFLLEWLRFLREDMTQQVLTASSIKR